MVGVVFSRVTRRGEDFLSFLSCTSLLNVFVAWMVFPRHSLLFPLQEIEWLHSPLLMFLAGIFSALGMTAMHHGMRTGHHGATWTIGQSALVFPFMIGILLWGDNVRITNLFGVVAILCAVMLFGMGHNRNSEYNRHATGRWLSIALLSLVLIGTQQTLTTIPSRWTDWQDVAHIRVPMMFTGAAIGYNTIRLISRRALAMRSVREGFFLCVCGLVSHLLLFRALDMFASFSLTAIAYPIAIGACNTVFAMYSVFCLKEKCTVRHALGMGAGCLGIVLVAL
jgi:uncharacterized membrane protein